MKLGAGDSDGAVRILLLVFLASVSSVFGTSTVPSKPNIPYYLDNFCYCDLDAFLKSVQKALAQNKTVPAYTPPDFEKLTDDFKPITTEEVTAKRRKRETEETVQAEVEKMKAEMLKRKEGKIQEIHRYYYLSSDESLTTMTTTGVLFNDSKPVSCSCEPGSIVELKLCLLNLNFVSDLEDPKKEAYKQTHFTFMNRLLDILYKGLRGSAKEILFRRAKILRFEKYDDEFEKNKTMAVVEVQFSKEIYQADYHVKNSVEPTVRIGNFGPYTTDHEVCIHTEDKTPVKPEEKPPLWYLRFVCLPIALAVAVAIVVITCIGKRDVFYVRFW